MRSITTVLVNVCKHFTVCSLPLPDCLVSYTIFDAATEAAGARVGGGGNGGGVVASSL